MTPQVDVDPASVVASGMRIVLTEHAIERYQKRVDPDASRDEVTARILAATPVATGERTHAGDAVWRFGDCDAVVKFGREFDRPRTFRRPLQRRSQRAQIVLVVTVLRSVGDGDDAFTAHLAACGVCSAERVCRDADQILRDQLGARLASSTPRGDA